MTNLNNQDNKALVALLLYTNIALVCFLMSQFQVPEFDNLYLDMNGIIHTCSHPNDNDPHFRISEDQMFKDIFRYIEVC